MALEGSAEDPVLPLTRVINDHITGTSEPSARSARS